MLSMSSGEIYPNTCPQGNYKSISQHGGILNVLMCVCNTVQSHLGGGEENLMHMLHHSKKPWCLNISVILHV